MYDGKTYFPHDTEFTVSLLLHEMLHAEELILIGKENYLAGVNGTQIQKLYRTIKREEYVNDRIMSDFRSLLSDEELILQNNNYLKAKREYELVKKI